ncbi:MAG: hypothetical protein MUF21_05645 [Gemmatimonadaceae bacterium]|jgi:hypothetical protein|nr:hypothetical protein [Gemmatimonadaceae bacterium]
MAERAAAPATRARRTRGALAACLGTATLAAVCMTHEVAAQVPASLDSLGRLIDTLTQQAVRGTQLVPGSVRCDGERITRVDFVPRPPGFTGRSAASRIVTWPVRAFHATTKPRVLDAYMQLKPGQRCREIARQESERIIRQLWFVQDVQVAAFPDRDGVRIEVRSIDEFSIIANPQLRNNTSIVGGRVGWNNVGGLGTLVEIGTRDNGILREGLSFRMRTAQLAGRPLQAGITWNRWGLGQSWAGEIRYPFLTDLQRYAWRATVGSDDDFVEYRRPVDPVPFQNARREWAALGGVRRFGGFGRTFLLGASLTRDDEDIGGAVFIDSARGAQPFPQSLPARPEQPKAVTRVNALFGARALRFLTVEGFDALTGTQDLRLGLQFSGQFGRSVARSGGDGDAFYLGSELYAGWGAPTWYAATEWFWSGRHDGGGWDGRVASNRSALYWRPRRTALTTVESQYVGAERMRVPFQVGLGGGATGLAGYRRSREGGDARLRLRLEQRQLLGRPFGFLDFGVAAFVEGGRLWAGDAPFGVDTPWRRSAGFALIGALPPRSRRTLRLDVVWPLDRDAFVRSVQLRATSGNFARFFWRDPGEARRGRERSLFADLFNF